MAEQFRKTYLLRMNKIICMIRRMTNRPEIRIIEKGLVCYLKQALFECGGKGQLEKLLTII